MIETLPSYRDTVLAGPSIEWLRSPMRPALQVASALDHVRRAPTILEAMRLRADLVRMTDEAIHDGVAAGRLLEPIMEAIDDRSDTVAGAAAVHALAQVPGSAAEAELSRLLFDAAPGFEEHAAWAMTSRTASASLVEVLASAMLRGGIVGMHVQGTLARWAASEPDLVLPALERRLRGMLTHPSRRYLVETIGLVPTRLARLTLERIAADPAESEAVRVTAIEAFSERVAERLPRSIGQLAKLDGHVGQAVRRTRAQRRLSSRGPRRTHDRSQGIRVAQIHLGAVLDEHVSRAGMGDTGGVATLLSHLGIALASRPRVAEVVTIGRSLPSEPRPSTRARAGHRFESVPLEGTEGSSFTTTWPSLVAARRGIRAALLATGVPDVLHLRMADPGSLAGAVVARELGIPTVFTLAPDPHGPIADAERRGELDRRSFAREDALGALWFRANLVEQLAAGAREIALFPRPNIRESLRDLVGVDIAAGQPRYTIVAEGVDTRRADSAAARLAAGETPGVMADLEAAIAALPFTRHGLPLAVSVGRLNEMKGMARVVAAFATDPELSASANLVIVGGDLEQPSATEAAELARIESILDRHAGLRDGVVLLGHRANDDVAFILAAARAGYGSTVGPEGAYVCGSRKEEFGIAIVEAMAAGLPVVAPKAGGPASYVEDGVTGALVDTTVPLEIATGLRNALELSSHASTAVRARAVVDDHYTLERMAQTLAALYRVSTGAGTMTQPIDTRSAV